MASELLKRRLTPVLCLLTLGLTACEGGVTLDQVAGHYEGFVVTRATPDSVAVQTSASAEIKKTSAASVALTLHGDSQPANIAFEASFSARGRIQLSSSSGYFHGTLDLVNTTGNCFADSDKNLLCLNGREIQFAFSGVGTKIVLDKMDHASIPVREDPQDYTIEQLVTRAKTLNFDNQVEFENTVQARLAARNAYLNLLPHINVGTGLSAATAVLGALSGAILTAVRSIGDLLPFFLPSRWYIAQADAAKSAAELDSYKIVQASSMNIVQGLALSVLRDEQAIERLNENKLSMIQVRDEILATEYNGAGDVQLGASDQINLVINALDRSIEAIQEALREERTALSQGAGFMNPEAVQLVQPIPVGPVTGALAGTLEDWQNLAVRRSVNLLQMDDLAVYAQKMRAARKFQWLDPNGDDSGSLGFGFIDYIAIGNSMVRQIYDKRQATQSLLMKKVADTLTQSLALYHDYQLELEAARLNQRLIDRYLLNFHSGIAFNVSDLANALQGKAAADMSKLGDEYAFQVLQSQMDYLTFSGSYAQLLSGNPPTPN